MGGEDLFHETDTPCRWQVGQANQTGVLAALQEDEAAEMLVQGNQDPFFRCGLGEQGSIARIRPELPRLQDIVPLFFEPVGDAATCTVVDQESHASYAFTASMESFAMTARA